MDEPGVAGLIEQKVAMSARLIDAPTLSVPRNAARTVPLRACRSAG
jgi:hypothetical protein